MNKRTKLLLLSNIFFAMYFLFLGIYVDKDIFRDVDYYILVKLQDVISRKFDIPLSFFTLLGSTEVTGMLIVVLFFLILVVYKRLFFGLLLYFMVFIVELGGKLIIYHPAPPSIFRRYTLGFHFPSSFFIHTAYSFPSGHMARSTFLTLVLFFLLMVSRAGKVKKILSGLGLGIFLTLMFISRIYLGEHWYSDVLGGAALGMITSALAVVFW